MSKRYRSLPEDEIADYLAQAQQGLAGVNPRAQTLARSGSRAGQQMVDAQLEQNQANRDKLAQDAERQAQVSQRQETDPFRLGLAAVLEFTLGNRFENLVECLERWQFEAGGFGQEPVPRAGAQII